MNRHYSKDTENYGYKYRGDFSDESLPAFFLLLLYIDREETRPGKNKVTVELMLHDAKTGNAQGLHKKCHLFLTICFFSIAISLL